MTGALRVGADIGGTFTDVTLLDAHGHMHLSKVLTTHHDPALAVLDGLQQAVEAAAVDLRDLRGALKTTGRRVSVAEMEEAVRRAGTRV